MARNSGFLRSLAVGIAFSLVAGGLVDSERAAAAHDPLQGWTRDLHPRGLASGQIRELPDRYLVRFADGTTQTQLNTARAQVQADGGQVYYTYSHALLGFAASAPPSALSRLRSNPAVRHIEPDFTITAAATQPNPPSWGLERIDKHTLPLDHAYNYAQTGAGVSAYVIDTGIRATHHDFTGRVGPGFDVIGDKYGTDDCNGHGTHVAGTIGGTAYGVAKDVTLVPVRVLDCDGTGTISGVIEGVDWVTTHHNGPSVANMSLGGVTSDTLDAAVAKSLARGVTYVVAAGNDSGDACTYSPGRVSGTITVGATTRSDARADYSNYGRCVALFAPGDEIDSDYGTGDTTVATLSGTSMAAPHVTGVVAQFLQANPSATPAQVRSAVVGAASVNVLTAIGDGSPNRLLFSALTPLSAPTPYPPSPPGAPILRMGPPRVVLSPGVVDSNAVPVAVVLTPVQGATAYQVQRSSDGKTWTDVPLPTPTTDTVGLRAVPGQPLRVRSRAMDGQGRPGDWTEAAAPQLAISKSGAATFSSPKDWTDGGLGGAVGDKVVSSSTKSATATFSFNGTQFAWLADRGAARGRAVISIDGKQRGMVDLYSPTELACSVVFLATDLGPGAHTVQIMVDHTKNDRATDFGVDVDGWVTAS